MFFLLYAFLVSNILFCTHATQTGDETTNVAETTKLESKIILLTQKLEASKEAMEIVTKQKQDLFVKNVQLSQKVQKLENSKASSQSNEELKEQNEECNQVKKTLAEAKTKIQELEEIITQSKKENEELKKQNEEGDLCKKKLVKKNAKIESLETQITQSNQELKNCTATNQKLTTQTKLLELRNEPRSKLLRLSIKACFVGACILPFIPAISLPLSSYAVLGATYQPMLASLGLFLLARDYRSYVQKYNDILKENSIDKDIREENNLKKLSEYALLFI